MHWQQGKFQLWANVFHGWESSFEYGPQKTPSVALCYGQRLNHSTMTRPSKTDLHQLSGITHWTQDRVKSNILYFIVSQDYVYRFWKYIMQLCIIITEACFYICLCKVSANDKWRYNVNISSHRLWHCSAMVRGGSQLQYLWNTTNRVWMCENSCASRLTE